jgi:hypothetical protein
MMVVRQVTALGQKVRSSFLVVFVWTANQIKSYTVRKSSPFVDFALLP